MSERLPILRVRTDYGDLRARDGIILCFFMHRSHGEVIPAVWRVLQTYRREIPSQALGWYPDDNGDFQPLNAKGWEYIRKKMLDRHWPVPCSVELEEHCDEAGGYNFEYQGHWLDDTWFLYDEDPTCAVSFTLPIDYLMEKGAAHVQALALELARELPFSFGYASFGLVAPGGQWFMAHRTVRELKNRYLGLDIYRLGETSEHIGTRARGAYWLTFLGLPLLGRLGGLENLRRHLAFPEVSLQTLPPLEGERVLIRLGDWPEAIDTAQQERPSPQLLALAHLLDPFLHEEKTNWFRILGDVEEMRRWIHRFCP